MWVLGSNPALSKNVKAGSKDNSQQYNAPHPKKKKKKKNTQQKKEKKTNSKLEQHKIHIRRKSNERPMLM